ncbi:MAG: fasciclin domain-containing protein [Ginsengibacter sp.]
MKHRSNPFRATLLFGALILLVSISACKKDTAIKTDNTINGIVSTDADFSTLNSAVMKGGLSATLSGTGPFTVFAPTNEAFTASGITSAVLASLTSDQAKNILLYHTITSKILAAQVPAGPNAPVLAANGDTLYVTNNSNGVFVNGIKVTQANVQATNGVIHVIGNVLMPPSGNIVQMAQADTSLSYLVAAVITANLQGALSGSGPLTVFAPTNNAFRAAGFPTIASIQAASPATLTSILTYHVIGARVFSSDLTDGEQATTLNGEKVTIGLTSGATVKGMSNTSASNIIATNIVATNGVIHVIDQVLLP